MLFVQIFYLKELLTDHSGRYTVVSKRFFGVEYSINGQILRQECIPVGCVPSAAVAVSLGGGCLLQGMSAPGVGV